MPCPTPSPALTIPILQTFFLKGMKKNHDLENSGDLISAVFGALPCTPDAPISRTHFRTVRHLRTKYFVQNIPKRYRNSARSIQVFGFALFFSRKKTRPFGFVDALPRAIQATCQKRLL